VFDAPKVAVVVGTMDGDQFAAAFQTLEPGLEDQFALCASAATVANHKPPMSIRRPLRSDRDPPGLFLTVVLEDNQRATALHQAEKEHHIWKYNIYMEDPKGTGFYRSSCSPA
jgi:hypothetical protein